MREIAEGVEHVGEGGIAADGAAMIYDPNPVTSEGTPALRDQGDRDFAVARYEPDGSLDAAFGTGGKVTTDIGTNSIDDGRAVASGVYLIQLDAGGVTETRRAVLLK